MNDMIVVVYDIVLVDMMQFKMQLFQVFVIDFGGCMLYMVIVVCSFGILVVVGVQYVSLLICQDDLIIVDGDQGIVIVDLVLIVFEEYLYCQFEKLLE